MSSQSIDTVSTGNDTGFYEIRNGEDFTDYDTIVATEEAVYGAEGAADFDDFEPHYGEEESVIVGGSRLEGGWATGNAKDSDKMNAILEELESDMRINPEGEVYEIGWKEELSEGYLEQSIDESETSGRNVRIERAIENYKEERNF